MRFIVDEAFVFPRCLADSGNPCGASSTRRYLGILPLARAQLREIATTATLAAARSTDRVTAANLEDVAVRATALLDG